MILLTFNLINSDSQLKNGAQISEVELLKITEENTNAILRILENQNTKATFFVEISIAESLKILLKKIISKGHEVSLYNKNSSSREIENVKKNIEDFLEKQIRGFRRKNEKIPVQDLKLMEFSYISNIENANILFPLKRLERTTEIVENQGLSFVPESISPYSQIPYNDFTFQFIPQKYYQSMVFETVKSDDYVLIYLNAWQFTDLQKYPFKLPFYRKYNSGRKMEDKLEEFLSWMNERELPSSRIKDYIL